MVNAQTREVPAEKEPRFVPCRNLLTMAAAQCGLQICVTLFLHILQTFQTNCLPHFQDILVEISK